MAWLVQSKRLKGYSLVPSVVVQSKSTRSDVMKGAGEDGNGSRWKDTLERDALGDGGLYEPHHVAIGLTRVARA